MSRVGLKEGAFRIETSKNAIQLKSRSGVNIARGVYHNIES